MVHNSKNKNSFPIIAFHLPININTLNCTKMIIDLLEVGWFKGSIGESIFLWSISQGYDGYQIRKRLWNQNPVDSAFCQFWHGCTNDVKGDEKHWNDFKNSKSFSWEGILSPPLSCLHCIGQAIYNQYKRRPSCPLQCIGERKVLTQPYYQTRISFIWAVADPPAYKYRKHISTLCIGTIKPFSGKLYLSALHMYNVQYTSAPKSMNLPISLPRQMHIQGRIVIWTALDALIFSHTCSSQHYVGIIRWVPQTTNVV